MFIQSTSQHASVLQDASFTAFGQVLFERGERRRLALSVVWDIFRLPIIETLCLAEGMGRNRMNKGKMDMNRAAMGEPLKYDDIWKRQRKERINHSPSKLNVDVHGILFAVVAVVFVVYPLIQWALGR